MATRANDVIIEYPGVNPDNAPPRKINGFLEGAYNAWVTATPPTTATTSPNSPKAPMIIERGGFEQQFSNLEEIIPRHSVRSHLSLPVPTTIEKSIRSRFPLADPSSHHRSKQQRNIEYSVSATVEKQWEPRICTVSNHMAIPRNGCNCHCFQWIKTNLKK
ncbi:hypothetical protein AVEN_25609-1 [Araneus ventricosus]|uniref:Uncharacterized protein n=1 Tax=Araneus ventricosus TaxID=182803 RepID=A0A4Y2BNG3_ARAVE|nr:hypothetical protein AVEN_25609-1 [Araneus ventricosus]